MEEFEGTGSLDKTGGGGLPKIGTCVEILAGLIILPTKYWPEMAGGGIQVPKPLKWSTVPWFEHILLLLLALEVYGISVFFSPTLYMKIKTSNLANEEFKSEWLNDVVSIKNDSRRKI